MNTISSDLCVNYSLAYGKLFPAEFVLTYVCVALNISVRELSAASVMHNITSLDLIGCLPVRRSAVLLSPCSSRPPAYCGFVYCRLRYFHNSMTRASVAVFIPFYCFLVRKVNALT